MTVQVKEKYIEMLIDWIALTKTQFEDCIRLFVSFDLSPSELSPVSQKLKIESNGSTKKNIQTLLKQKDLLEEWLLLI